MDVYNKHDLQNKINSSTGRHLILYLHGNDYGTISINNKHNITLTSSDFSSVKINIEIKNKSSQITIKNLNLTSSLVTHEILKKKKWQLVVPFIIKSNYGTSDITIKNCIISSYEENQTSTSFKAIFKFPENNVLTENNLTVLDTKWWVDGIMMRCSRGKVLNNVITKVRRGIQAGSSAKCSKCEHNLIKNNMVQFFSEDGIRGIGHNVAIKNNKIYDPVIFDLTNPDNNNHQDAVQIFPTRNTYCGGILENLKIIDNDISVNKGVKIEGLGTCLQGIFASDGYLKNITIKGNTIAVNSSHGISLNGPRNVRIENNSIELLETSDGCNQGPSSTSDIFEHPGIKLNYTRKCNGNKWVWRNDNKFNYSVLLINNTAPTLLIPKLDTQKKLKQFVVTRYEKNDKDTNTFINEGDSSTYQHKCPRSRKCP